MNKKLIILGVSFFIVILFFAYLFLNLPQTKQCEDYSDELGAYCASSSECPESAQPFINGEKLKCPEDLVCCLGVPEKRVIVISNNT